MRKELGPPSILGTSIDHLWGRGPRDGKKNATEEGRKKTVSLSHKGLIARVGRTERRSKVRQSPKGGGKLLHLRREREVSRGTPRKKIPPKRVWGGRSTPYARQPPFKKESNRTSTWNGLKLRGDSVGVPGQEQIERIH